MNLEGGPTYLGPFKASEEDVPPQVKVTLSIRADKYSRRLKRKPKAHMTGLDDPYEPPLSPEDC